MSKLTKLIPELEKYEDYETVNGIQFSLFSHKMIDEGAVTNIITPDTYEGNLPKDKGLFDLNMGTLDYSIPCRTDGNNSELCPGYFGKIDLGQPVYYYHYLPFVEKLLKCVCFRCSNLLINKSDPAVLKMVEEKKGFNRFNKIVQLCSKIKKCEHNNGCNLLQPIKYYRQNLMKNKDKDNIIKIMVEFDDSAISDETVKKNQLLTPEMVYNIFSKITDENVDFLGFNSKYSRPEWMICKLLPVPPPSVRPSVRQDNSNRSEDDLTYALSNIIKSNKQLKDKISNLAEIVKANGSEETIKKLRKDINDLQGSLQYNITTYMDNKIPNIPASAHRSNRPLKAISQRIKGDPAKDGRIRNNIQGKRVDYSARTVISVDPNIDIDEFGVPEPIVKNLTFPEIVTRFNIDKLTKAVRNGPYKYPGAKSIKRNGSHNFISLRSYVINKDLDLNTIELNYGDIVERHLLDGDYALFNRQPSLHRMNMMAHKIKVVPFNTFRLNVTVTSPYNADFDGDEMNMHVPRSIMTFEELKQIASVPTQIIAPGNSKPIIKIVQDSLVGSYTLTRDETIVDRNLANNLLIYNNDYDGKLEKKDYYTGREIMSTIIPNVNYENTDDWGNHCVIERGIIKEGKVAANALGSSSSGLIQQTYNIYGHEECSHFLNKVQALATRWMTHASFSVSFGDCLPSIEIKSDIPVIIREGIMKTKEILKSVYDGVYNPDLDRKYLVEAVESDLRGSLSKISKDLGNLLMKNIKKDNGILTVIESGGTKAKKEHVAQISGTVGQQDIWGKMIGFGYNDRTLPHFHRLDMGPDSRGYVRNSFIKGLTASEMFFHAMGSRTGTIDTAIKSVVGTTPIIIQEGDEVKYVKIGDWIDNLLEKENEKVKNYEEKEMELLDIEEKDIYIPTTDFDGNVSWGLIKNITRHDPGKELYEIKTHGGREVIVTESHSLLIWNGNQFERKNSSLAKIGDFVPVTAKLEKFKKYNLISIELIKEKYGNNTNNLVFKDNEERDKINFNLNLLNVQTILNKNRIKIIENEYFETKNDVVLDAITEINKIDISLYPKVYDLTIPSTLNFGLANGLHVVDTADSGYISRKFIKATEDLKVYYDGTVRNASGFIVQTLYGDDCFDPIKLEKSKVELLEFDNETMKEKFQFEDVNNGVYWASFVENDVVDEFMEEDDLEDKLEEEFNLMMEYRRLLREEIFNDISYTADSNSFVPINLYRVIKSIRNNFNITDYSISDLSPLYVLNKLDYMIDKITKYLPEKNESMLLMKIIFRTHLSSKRVIYDYRLSKLAFDFIIDKTINKVIESFCAPGEMVGVIASQTLGEISTQMTLNSVSWNSPLFIKQGKNCQVKNIGDFIDTLLHNHKENIIPVDSVTNTEYLDVKDKKFYIQSVDENGKMYWKLIEGITRHDPGGKVVRIRTESGRSVVATMSKSFLVRRENKIVPIEGNKVKIGDYLPVQKNVCENEDKIEFIEFDETNPLHICEMNIRKNIKSIIKENKVITQEYGDDEIIPSVKLASNSITDFSVKQLKDIYNSTKDVGNMYVIDNVFKEECYYDKIIELEVIDLEDETPDCNKVYDLTVKDTKNFNLLGGLCMRDTFHLSGSGGASLVITQGVPRLNEIIKLSSMMKSKNMNIYLNPEISKDKEKVIYIKNKFQYKKLVDLVSKTDIIYENAKNMQISEDIEFLNMYSEIQELFGMEDCGDIEEFPWVLRITFDKESLLNSNIRMSEIQETIIGKSKSDEDIRCPFSDDNSSDLVLRINIRNDAGENFISFMNDYEKQLLDLRLRGIEGIDKIEPQEHNYLSYNEDGTCFQDKEWILQTEGSNLLEIMSQDGVDTSRTTTNDILEIFDVFGIEAARQKIYEELSIVFEGKPNPRHIELIADVMTYRGKMMQIDRHGINRNVETGPIAKASFEETINIFVKSAVFAEHDKMKGVSANILAGQLCNCGINNFQVLVDEEKIIKYSVEEEDIKVIKEINIEEVNDIIDKDLEKKDDISHQDFEFGFGLEDIGEFNIQETKTIEKSTVYKVDEELINVEENSYIESNDEENDLQDIDINEPKIKNIKLKEDKEQVGNLPPSSSNIQFQITKVDEDEDE